MVQLFRHLKYLSVLCVILIAVRTPMALAQGAWEITPQSERAVEEGLRWLAENQGPQGNWGSQDLGLVAMGTLAFLSAGHGPGRGPYGEHVERSLNYIISNARPSGLLNIANQRRDMYNHGLATFVLTQAYGMTDDPRVAKTLERALTLIVAAQARDGGWDYIARRQDRGHDLSLVVMQAKALRGAQDIGLDLPPRSIQLAINAVRRYYKPFGRPDGKAAAYGAPGNPLANQPGQFTYDGRKATLAMAAAGVVCLQEFGEYDDFRIKRSMDVVIRELKNVDKRRKQKKLSPGKLPMDAYTLYYVGQALYQVGGTSWDENYAGLRDAVVQTQSNSTKKELRGSWQAGAHVSGKPGLLYGTAAGVFILSIPNRYLPILQEAALEDQDR